MSRAFATIEGGKVANVILADEWPGAIDVTDLTPRPGPGWAYDGSVFSPPAPAPAPSLGTRITRLAFRQRIGTSALVGIELAAIHNPSAPIQAQQLAASLRVMLEDVRSASYIDLSRPDTRAGV